jgi:hypothetical protein
VIHWATEDWKSVLLHDGVNPSRITVPSGFTGTLVLRAHAEITSTVAGGIELVIRKNGSNIFSSSDSSWDDVTGILHRLNAHYEDQPTAGDYYEAFWTALVAGGTFSTSNNVFSAYQVI